jgi:uncharacterized Fe-S cluster-containing radical SAM superfamily enzyme
LCGIEECCTHAEFRQRIDLVLHQCNQRRNHHPYPIAYQRGNLVTQRLAAAGRHQDERVSTARHLLDDRGLVAAKGRIAKYGLKNMERARADGLFRHPRILICPHD